MGDKGCGMMGGESVQVPARLCLDFMEEPDHIGKINPAVAIEIHNPGRGLPGYHTCAVKWPDYPHPINSYD